MIKRITFVFCLFYLLSITSAFAYEMKHLIKLKDGTISEIGLSEKNCIRQADVAALDNIENIHKYSIYFDFQSD